MPTGPDRPPPWAVADDLIIALTAEAHGLTLAHLDADLDAIAKVRPGIAMVRIDQPNASRGDDRVLEPVLVAVASRSSRR